jgi:hypothetical protein
MDELERVELAAILDFFAAAPADVADELDLAVCVVDGGTAFSIGAEPKPLLFNRALGLVDSARVAELEQWFRSRNCPLAVSVRPGAALEHELRERGYRAGRAYMKFRRDLSRAPERPTSLGIEPIRPKHAGQFGKVVAEVFGVPEAMARWFAALCGRERWTCFGAFDGDLLVGTGATYVAGDHAWLGIATTLPNERGRGSQSAILSARIGAAGEAGARVLAVETSDRVDGVAGPSFRNVVRAGFEEAYRQTWWHPPDVPAADA